MERDASWGLESLGKSRYDEEEAVQRSISARDPAKESSGNSPFEAFIFTSIS
jgi:hypothetical protein